MRSTVGPLPAAVYWRRRAVVLGAALLGIIVLFVSCSGGDDNKGSPRDKAASSSSSLHTPAPAGNSPSDQPTFVDSVPGGGPSLPDPNSLETRQAGGDRPTGTAASQPAGSGTNTNVNAATGGSCPDNQMSVTPVPSSST